VELDTFLAGYEQFREFDHTSLRLIEVLRGLRYVHYAAWVASRWDDPSFKRAVPGWGSEAYWEGQTADLYEQLQVIADSSTGFPY
jgi:Ser/Thr protein kinase RdoA (MazF antagonist)